MIDEGLRCSGSGLAVQRFTNCIGHVDWKQHSTYMGLKICRAFRKGDGRACGLYAAQFYCVLLVAENLGGIKREIKAVIE